MSTVLKRTIFVTFGFVRESCEQFNGIFYPIVVKKMIVLYTSKTIKSQILSFKDDNHMLMALNKRLLLVNPRIELLFAAGPDTYGKLNKFVDEENTLTLIETQSNEIFGIYVEKTWNFLVFQEPCDDYSVLFHFNKSTREIKIVNGHDYLLDGKIRKDIDLSVIDMPRCVFSKNDMNNNKLLHYEVFKILDYQPSIVDKKELCSGSLNKSAHSYCTDGIDNWSDDDLYNIDNWSYDDIEEYISNAYVYFF